MFAPPPTAEHQPQSWTYEHRHRLTERVARLDAGSLRRVLVLVFGDANGFPCWRSTEISLFLFFFRGEWILHHECIREDLGQPYFPPRRPLACEAFLPTLDRCPVGSHLWMVQSRKKWVSKRVTVRALVDENLLEARQRLAAAPARRRDATTLSSPRLMEPSSISRPR